MTWLSALSGLLPIALLAAAPTSPNGSLEPTGKWVVDNGATQCVALREFGSGDQKTILKFKPSPLSDGVEVELIQDGVHVSAFQQDLELQLDVGAPIKTTMLIYGFKTETGSGKKAYWANVPAATFLKMSLAHQMRFKSAALDLTFPLDKLGNVATLLAKCVEVLRDTWNIGTWNPPRLQKGATLIRPLSTVLSDSDYPTDAIMQQQGGTSGFVLLIDENGKVADCTLFQPSGIALLDAQSCIAVSARAKFAPAIGMDGKPAKTAFTQKVRWSTHPR